MVKTIGNPLTWTFGAVSATGNGLAEATGNIGGRAEAPPVVREVTLDDLMAALRAGWDDFLALRSDVMAMVLLYPLIGLVLSLAAFDANFAPYLFPLASGFALVGPLAAVGLYELSRRREAGMDTGWTDAFALLSARSLGPLVAMGVILLAIFTVWMMAANLIHALTLGTDPHATTAAFVAAVFGTLAGWQMIVIGTLVGFAFAFLVLAISLVSFPLLIDRNVGVPVAIVTSLAVARRNPQVTAAWGLMVAAVLILGSIPLFLGLIVAVPVLGHATWHFYRRAVG